MQGPVHEEEAVLDVVADLTADITDAPDRGDLQRLRSLVASAVRRQREEAPEVPPVARPTPRLLPIAHEDDVREVLRSNLRAAKAPDAKDVGVLHVKRRDGRELLLEGRLVDSLSGLAPGECLGPFIVIGGAEIWFDVFFAARRIVLIEAGASAPALVMTKARPPVTSGGVTKIDLEAGTVWVRGDLLDGSMPSGAFVGIRVKDGLLKIDGPASVSGDTVEVGSPLRADLRLALAEDAVAPAAEGCVSSGAKVALPNVLRFRFQAGGTFVEGSAGRAHAWGQEFEFAPSTGSWTFVEPLWTLVLGYKVVPDKLDTDPIPKDLVDFQGAARITGAGLGLPVVVAPSPAAILGDAAHAAGWWLSVQDFGARWYEPDLRLHTIAKAWVGISARGAILYAEGIPPLSPPLAHSYALWSITDGDGQRVPWRQTYEQPFVLVYRCDAVIGEQLVVTGQSTVTFDRPVQIDGVPIATPTTQGALLLHRLGGKVNATLGAVVERDGAVQRLALRNALVWTTQPAAMFVNGALVGPQRIDAGEAHLLLGVFAWIPTLPDPYVANFHIRRPDIDAHSRPRSLLVARVSWSSPDDISVSFEGQLGQEIALAGREPSRGDPKPATAHRGSPDVGPTQVGQNRLSLDEATAASVAKARDAEITDRAKRIELAKGENAKSREIIDGYLARVLGPTPQTLLLDVSTNQDLLGVALGVRLGQHLATHVAAPALSLGAFPVSRLAVHSQVENMRVVSLPQIQWEPVRTLDPDQDIMTLGWFPTPLASATDGGPTQLGARSQRLVPSIPEDALRGTYDAYAEGTPVAFGTTLPFGLVAAVQLQPKQVGGRQPDSYELTRPEFPVEDSVGGLQITALAESGRPDLGGVSPCFEGWMRQLINGVDLASGASLGLSVLGSTGDPGSNVETIFNDAMTAHPRVPVNRFDLSGYGGSNFSDWNNPFAAFAEAAKVQFRVVVGRTALEVIKINSVLHPWGIRVTRSVTIERRPGGGVIRRDSGWQAFTPGLFDYRYFDTHGNAKVADYEFDTGVFRGLFNARSIRPAPGSPFSHGDATMFPYYFDAEVALDGMDGRTRAAGVLGYLQTAPPRDPASEAALQSLLEAQGPIGGPIDAWLDFGGSGLPFRARRIEIGLAMDGSHPIFVATVRGVPKLPRTGAWSVVKRPVASVPVGGGEAVPVSENEGVPLIRRAPIRYFAGDVSPYTEPPLCGPPSSAGDYRFADARDLLTPSAPANDYALLQSTPTHAFLFPRPYVPSSGAARIQSDAKGALADVIARSTSKGAFPPPQNTIELGAGSVHFDVGPGGTLALSSPISIVNHPTPLRIAGSEGHGSTLRYDDATLNLELDADEWSAEFTGLRIWADILGLQELTGSEMRIVGSTHQRPQIAELKTLILKEIEDILRYIPIFGNRGVQGPIDLGASNAVHEIKLQAELTETIPPTTLPILEGVELKLRFHVNQSTGFDLETGGIKASAAFGASLDGTVGHPYFVIVTLKIEFGISSISGTVTSETLNLLAFVGAGVRGKIGPFHAYAFLGIGFLLVYEILTDTTKYGGLVALEAGVEVIEEVLEVKLRAELQGLLYDDKVAGKTKCDYSGKVKLQVSIFLFFSISATYQITDTATI